MGLVACSTTYNQYAAPRSRAQSNWGRESPTGLSSNFRSSANIEVELNDLTVLIGANNAGKTSFLDAMFAAIGSGRKLLGQDDIRLMHGEAMPPKDRRVVVDIRIRPLDENGKVVDKFPEGSFWTALWGPGIVLDDQDFDEFMAFRTTLAWRVEKAGYVVERLFLKEWKPFEEWIDTPTQDKPITAAQLEPVRSCSCLLDKRRQTT